MQADLQTIITKFRSLVLDFDTSSLETFSYTTSDIFTLEEGNITAIAGVYKNGIELESGEYSFNSTTNKLTITLSSGDAFAQGDIIEVDYTFNKYSDTECLNYIRNALVHISISSYGDDDYELESDGIYPTPSNKTNDLISLVASILAKPDYLEYRLPNLTVKYPRTMVKEDKVEKLITKFQMGLGVSEMITYE